MRCRSRSHPRALDSTSYRPTVLPTAESLSVNNQPCGGSLRRFRVKSAAQPARCFVWDAAASGFDTSSGLAFRSNLPFVGFPLLVLPVVRGIEQSLRRIRLVSAVRTTTLDSAPPVAIVMASQCWQQRGSFETRKASTVLCSLLASPRDVHDPLSNHQRDEGIRKGSGLSRLPWLLVASSRQDERAMIVIYR